VKVRPGNVAVITGAGSGLGRALALRLAERRCVLALADINETGLNETCGQVDLAGAACSSHVVDVASRAAVEAFADVAAQHGPVNLLINNAGVTLVDEAENMVYEDFEWVMQINFWGVVYGTKAFLPALRRADAAHIVNLSSLFGLVGMPLQSAYNASKFAVRGFTEALKIELAGSHIGVSCVHPGGIKTGIGRNSRIRDVPLSEPSDEIIRKFEQLAMTSPDKAAAAIIRGIEKRRRRILVGPDARVIDWIARLEKLLPLEKNAKRRNAERARLKR
jgi:NAD(P)-dependent dehydrogenase (short-subunit alcohol dehydrogenase family)